MQVIFYKDKAPEVFVSKKEIETLAVWRTRTSGIIISDSKLNIKNME